MHVVSKKDWSYYYNPLDVINPNPSLLNSSPLLIFLLKSEKDVSQSATLFPSHHCAKYPTPASSIENNEIPTQRGSHDWNTPLRDSVDMPFSEIWAGWWGGREAEAGKYGEVSSLQAALGQVFLAMLLSEYLTSRRESGLMMSSFSFDLPLKVAPGVWLAHVQATIGHICELHLEDIECAFLLSLIHRQWVGENGVQASVSY